MQDNTEIILYQPNTYPKRLIVLDIDGTLIHGFLSHETPDKGMYDFDFTHRNGDHFYVKKRPHVDEFLTWLFRKYTVAFWSASDDEYVYRVLGFLLNDNMKPLFIWTQKMCSIKTVLLGPYNYGVVVYKKLHKVWDDQKFGFAKEQILIIDDTPTTYSYNHGNAIPISPFTMNQVTDTELLRIRNILSLLDNVENVLKVEKRPDHPLYLKT